ncbi:haloacid dehalogenase-like hydrolase [Metallibacterium sp.]|uniref:haloacid dehalogenase-like hydrolase n=1 Tax=Metallibacterium sp. TaxID=2940281 RepID=UPI002636354D|nr:haloacid dehalogenase-like hydrolase [Metallibacterium sp.]
MNQAVSSAAAATPRVVLFDFDGVLVRGDSFSGFLRVRVRRQAWRLALLLPLLPALPLLLLRRRGRRILLHCTVRLLLLGTSLSRYRALAESHARVQALRRGFFVPDAVSALRRHLLRGDRVIVVTGCEEHLARALLQAVRLDGVELVASRLRRSWLGAVPAVHNVGREKLRQMEAHGVEPPFACVYSDAGADLPMLLAAERAVLVNPGESLRARMQARLGSRYAEVEWS